MNVSAWSIRNPIPAIVLFMLLTLAGVLAFRALKVSNMPDVDLPMVTLNAALPGAAPAQLETEVARKLENSIAAVQGLKHLYTSIGDGLVVISAEFRLDKPVQEALDDVRAAVTRVRADLPGDLRDPVVQKADLAAQPILTYTVASERLDDEALSWFVDNQVARTLLAVRGVGAVTRVGGVTREVRVELDPARLMARGATAAEVSRALRQVQLDASGGRGDLGGAEQALRLQRVDTGTGGLLGGEDLRGLLAAEHAGGLQFAGAVGVGHGLGKHGLRLGQAGTRLRHVGLQHLGGQACQQLASLDGVAHLRGHLDQSPAAYFGAHHHLLPGGDGAGGGDAQRPVDGLRRGHLHGEGRAPAGRRRSRRARARRGGGLGLRPGRAAGQAHPQGRYRHQGQRHRGMQGKKDSSHRIRGVEAGRTVRVADRGAGQCPHSGASCHARRLPLAAGGGRISGADLAALACTGRSPTSALGACRGRAHADGPNCVSSAPPTT